MVKKIIKFDFFPKLLTVSTQITGNIIRLITGRNNKITHQVGLLIIFIRIMQLYIGIKASQNFLPANIYNFHVPKK